MWEAASDMSKGKNIIEQKKIVKLYMWVRCVAEHKGFMQSLMWIFPGDSQSSLWRVLIKKLEV